MLSTKQSIGQLAALMLAHHITDIVLSPGARNAPLIQTFTSHPDFNTYTVVDERSAAFFAIGLILKHKRPVAVCCTSGTALLNFGSAVAEAHYQQLPLLVISADRPQAWINQLDDQTLQQPSIFGPLVKHSVQLTENKDHTEHWYNERVINEALLALRHRGDGPAHINIPLSEPLFDFTATSLPVVRTIRRVTPTAAPLPDECRSQWHTAARRIILVGQLQPDEALAQLLQELHATTDCVILGEHLSNQSAQPWCITHFDTFLTTTPDAARHAHRPDLVITIGRQILSKQLKQWLRTVAPIHWHITPTGEVADLFQSLDTLLEGSPCHYLRQLLPGAPAITRPFQQQWHTTEAAIKAHTHALTFAYSNIRLVQHFMTQLPSPSTLHIANSTSVRLAQLFPLKSGITICCNRGTSGIDGSLSTAVGYAATDTTPNYLLIGDLSFFYDMNALWNRHLSPHLRILLLNNGAGEMFHLMPALRDASAMKEYVAAAHTTQARAWAESTGCTYLSAHTNEEIDTALALFTSDQPTEAPLFLEVFTTPESNAHHFRGYYASLKQ